MAINSITFKTIEGLLNENQLKPIRSLYLMLFNDADANFFIKRIGAHSGLFSIMAFEGQTLVGFKIGYPYNNTTFYSWIGGVSPEYRRQGIAINLAALQEGYAKASGFKTLRAKSMNIYKPMMILNLKNGFDITKFYTNTKGQVKIVFEKQLS